MSTIDFVTPQHCLASFWRQTNIKISRDLEVSYGDDTALDHGVFQADPGSQSMVIDFMLVICCQVPG